MNINQFKIGDNLYKHGTFVGALKYVITDINSDTMDLECLSCRDHANCKIRVKFNRGQIIFDKMLNNPKEEYWHLATSPKDTYFYTSYKEYAHKVSAISIGLSTKLIKELEQRINAAKKEKESYITWLKELDVKGYNY